MARIRTLFKWLAGGIVILAAAALTWSIVQESRQSAGRKAIDAIGGAAALETFLIQDMSEACLRLYKRYRRAGPQKAFALARDTGACAFSANQMRLGGFGEFSASWAAVSDCQDKGRDCAVVSLNDDYIHLGDSAERARDLGLNARCTPAFVAHAHLFLHHSAFAYSPSTGGCGYSWRWKMAQEAASDAMKGCAGRYDDCVLYKARSE